MNKPLLLGGAVLGYFLFFRDKKKAVAAPRLSPGEAILADPSQLEGLSGYFSTGNTPCCRNCVDGRPCTS